jgi:predicted TIM-barrel fold metal-dependent hydrolase
MSFELYDIHSHSGIQRNNIFNEKVENLKEKSIPELLKEYEDRIDKIINFPMPGTVYFNYEESSAVGKKSLYPYQVENEELIRAVEKYDKKEKILPFLCINPKVKVTEQLEGLYKLLKDNKVFGLKFHTLDANSSIDDLFSSSEIISFCREHKLPIIIHSGNYNNVEDCKNIFEYAEKNKDLNFCVAHLMTFSEDFFKKMKQYKYENVFTDVSPFLGLCEYMKESKPEGSLNLDYNNPKKVIASIFNDYGKQILWGSDEPFGKFRIDNEKEVDYSLKEEINFLYSLDENTRKTIASVNSERFLFNNK